MDYQIRAIRENEYPILANFLYETIFIPKGAKKLPKFIIKQPKLQVYIADFGKEDDQCFVTEVERKIVRAVWGRIMDDYGHIDDDIPSFAISLSVQKANYAVNMYQKLCFVDKNDKEYIMICEL